MQGTLGWFWFLHKYFWIYLNMKSSLPVWWIDELSMVVLSKWQFGTLFSAPDKLTHLGLLTFIYLNCLCEPRRCEIHRKVRAPRHVSASGAPRIVTWIKQAWIKRQCTDQLTPWAQMTSSCRSLCRSVLPLCSGPKMPPQQCNDSWTVLYPCTCSTSFLKKKPEPFAGSRKKYK